MSEQIRDPHRVVHVGLAARHVAHVGRVGQHQFACALEHVPHRLPVHAGRFHCRMRDTEGHEPIGQREQALGRGREAPDFLLNLIAGCEAHACHHRVLVHVESGTAGVQHFHDGLPKFVGAGEEPASSNARNRPPGSRDPW